MSQEELTVDIKTEHNREAVIFRLKGSFDVATAPSVRAALLDAADQGKHEIVVDLTHIEFLDSTGLGALIGAHRRALEHGGRVRLIVSEGPISRLLNITGLLRIFAVYSTMECALADRDRLTATL